MQQTLTRNEPIIHLCSLARIIRAISKNTSGIITNVTVIRLHHRDNALRRDIVIKSSKSPKGSKIAT